MSIVIDNGNVHAVATDGRWTPRLNGDVYCSPACGFCCKKADFDRATERAQAIAKMLGGGWEPRVWENGGWHFEVKKSFCKVSASHIEGSYEATMQFFLDDRSSDFFTVTRSCPRMAVEAVHAVVKERIEALRRALMSMSLDVVEIELAE